MFPTAEFPCGEILRGEISGVDFSCGEFSGHRIFHHDRAIRFHMRFELIHFIWLHTIQYILGLCTSQIILEACNQTTKRFRGKR